MSRTIEGGHGGNPGIPDPPDIPGWVHWGDGYAGPLHASRIQGYDSGTLVYRDVAVNANGYLLAGLAVESVEIGTVDQGSPGASAWKVDGSGVTQPVSAASLPLPAGAATEATLAALSAKIANPLPVSAAALPLPAGAAKDSTLTDSSQRIGGTVAVTGTFFQVTQPVSIASMPSTPVTGTFWQTTQPVSIASMPSTPVTGPLTDTQLRATAVPVSLAALPALVAGSAVIGHVIVDTIPTVAFTSPQHVIVDSGAENVSATLAADAIGLAKDASLTSIFGSPTSDAPGSFTVLDQLSRIRKTAEQSSKTLQALLAAAQPAPARKTQATLLHRSL